ncbi:MAG TPA: hypothetical protein VK548_00660 [Candidatus Acidoferrum sp.]|nr:hypothetical protein [Candidatus Acidoferrum sp.]
MQRIELNLNFSALVRDSQRQDLAKSIEAFFVESGASPSSVECRTGSTEVIIAWILPTIVGVAADGGAILSAAVLKELGKAVAGWILKRCERSAPTSGAEANRIEANHGRALQASWDDRRDRPEVLSRLTEFERRLNQRLEAQNPVLAELIEASETIMITRREIVFDAAEDREIVREQTIQVSGGSLASITETIRSTINFSKKRGL